VNGDGYPDIVSCSFMDTEICWYENPGPEGLKKGELCKPGLSGDVAIGEKKGSTMGFVTAVWSAVRNLRGPAGLGIIMTSGGYVA